MRIVQHSTRFVTNAGKESAFSVKNNNVNCWKMPKITRPCSSSIYGGERKSRPNAHSLRDPKGEPCCDPQVVSETFKSYFMSVFAPTDVPSPSFSVKAHLSPLDNSPLYCLRRATPSPYCQPTLLHGSG